MGGYHRHDRWQRFRSYREARSLLNTPVYRGSAILFFDGRRQENRTKVSPGRESENLLARAYLKIICVVFGLLSLSSLIPGIQSIYSAHFGVVTVNHGRLDQILSLFNALLF